jgi:hypothetical protein
MEAISKVDWDTIDYDKAIGDYLVFADGTRHYIEMDMQHWYWRKFLLRKGQKVDNIARHAREVMTECSGYDSDEMVRASILALWAASGFSPRAGSKRLGQGSKRTMPMSAWLFASWRRTRRAWPLR